MSLPRMRDIGCYNAQITMEFDTWLDSIAAETHVIFLSDCIALYADNAFSGLYEIIP